jgi:hypothetical protein
MSPTEADMLDQPSKDTEKSAPGWRFLKLLGYSEAASPVCGARLSASEPDRAHQMSPLQ